MSDIFRRRGPRLSSTMRPPRSTEDIDGKLGRAAARRAEKVLRAKMKRTARILEKKIKNRPELDDKTVTEMLTTDS